MRRLRTRPTLFPYTTLFRSDLVIDEETADGREARVSRGSLCGSRGAVAGTLRYFADRFGTPRAAIRSEEHTSELQSLRHLVCRLLLEKKKDIKEMAAAIRPK